MRDRTWCLAASVAAVLAAGTVARAAGPASEQELQIKELERKVAALESQQARNSKDLATTVDAVLRDAERRSQLLADSGEMSAGYDSSFFIKGPKGFVLRPNAQFQFRNVTNYREDAKTDGDGDWENGFEYRRMKFALEGTAFGDLSYAFIWATDRTNGQLKLEEAWTRYMFADDWGVRFGQFKDPVTHEFVMSTKRQLAADTSLVDGTLGGGMGGWTQGALLVYGNYNPKNNLNVEAGITDGASQYNADFTGRTDFANAVPKPHTLDFGLVGRAEYRIMGDWKDYKDFTAMGTKEDLLVLGAGGDWSQGGDGNLILGTADLQYESPSGFGAYGALLLRYTDSDLTGFGGVDSTDWGFLVQGSYLLTGNWEVFGRYDAIFFDNEQGLKRAGVATGDSDDTFHEITVGVNYYMGTNGEAGHRAKFTVDLSYLPNGASKFSTGLGILDDNGGDNEWMLRAQFQLLL